MRGCGRWPGSRTRLTIASRSARRRFSRSIRQLRAPCCAQGEDESVARHAHMQAANAVGEIEACLQPCVQHQLKAELLASLSAGQCGEVPRRRGDVERGARRVVDVVEFLVAEHHAGTEVGIGVGEQQATIGLAGEPNHLLVGTLLCADVSPASLRRCRSAIRP